MQEFSMQIVSVLFALVIVIALAWLALRALKQFQLGGNSDDVLRFKRALPVGARERVVLVEYRGHDYLLGVTAGGITVLEKREADKSETADPGRSD